MGATTFSLSITMPSEAQELTRGLRRRDPDLLDQLIEQYHYRLFRYLLSLTGNREAAEDLFQESPLYPRPPQLGQGESDLPGGR